MQGAHHSETRCSQAANLTTCEVDAWLAGLASSLGTETLQRNQACLNRAVRPAMARDQVGRNLVELAEVPFGKGWPAVEFDRARAPGHRAGEDRPGSDAQLHRVVLLTGGRTKELRALRGEHMHLDGDPRHVPPLPPYVKVLRSVRARRHQNAAIAADACPTGSLRRGAAETVRTSGFGEAGGWGSLAGDRSRIHRGARVRDRRFERAA